MRGSVLGLVVALVVIGGSSGAAAQSPTIGAVAPPEWVVFQQAESPCTAQTGVERTARCRYRLDLRLVQAQPVNWGGLPFLVDGITLGSRIPLYSQAYLQYECTPSEQFAGFVWCSRRWMEPSPRGATRSSSTIMHSSNGTVQYVNRSIAPYFGDFGAAKTMIARLSTRFQRLPRLLNLPRANTHPGAVMAIWGDLMLEPLDASSRAELATVGQVRRGILVDFIGHFAHSAQWGLPIYRFAGGTGAVLVAAVDQGGRGQYRVFAINADALQAPDQVPEVASQPRPDVLPHMPQSIVTTMQSTPPAPPSQPTPPPAPRKETAKLKEARLFLEDAKAFIAEQKTIKQIDEIGTLAGQLQDAIDSYNEAEASRTMKKFAASIKQIAGYEAFAKEQERERRRAAERLLAEAKEEARKGVYFIDRYVAQHLGGKNTKSLLLLRKRLEHYAEAQSIDSLSDAASALKSYVQDNSLSELYEAAIAETPVSKESSVPPVEKSLEERLGIGEKAKFILSGANDDVILLYNATPAAPRVAKNVRGDFVFQNDTAALCFAQQAPETPLVRFVAHSLRGLGARTIILQSEPCNPAVSAASADIVAFSRGEMLKREDYLLSFVKLVENQSLRHLKTVTGADFHSAVQAGEALSLQYESDVEKNARRGYGVIALLDAPPAEVCVVRPKEERLADGLKVLMEHNKDQIAPGLTADWPLIDTTAEAAFLGLQKRQCGYATGDASTLRSLLEALRREKIAYEFAPVWFEDGSVVEAASGTRDEREQKLRKLAEHERSQREREALDGKRRQQHEGEKSVIEAKMREQNGPKARALLERIRLEIKAYTDHTAAKEVGFPVFLGWLEGRSELQWETFDVQTGIADFGTAQWKGRPLDSIIAKATIQQKNRRLGQYSRNCMFLGLIDDGEFSMLREMFSVECETSDAVIRKFKSENHFQSRWNAD